MADLVFIVEDNPVQQRILKAHFEEGLGNYVVETFDTPDDLLASLSQKPFAVVLDHFFGGKDSKTGLDYLREMRAKGIKTPVIFYTSLEDEDIKKEVMSLKAEAYINKDSASLVRLKTTLDTLHEKKKKGFFKRLFG